MAETDADGGWRARAADARRRFRKWRHRRPFWGGMLTVLSGLQVFASTQLTLGSMQVRVGVEGLQSIVIPIILLLAGLLIWFMPDHRVFYGVIALVVAVYSLVGVNLGGFLIGLLLGIAGGALAIAWAPRSGDVPDHAGSGSDDGDGAPARDGDDAGHRTDAGTDSGSDSGSDSYPRSGGTGSDEQGTVSVDELLDGGDRRARDGERDAAVREPEADDAEPDDVEPADVGPDDTEPDDTGADESEPAGSGARHRSGRWRDRRRGPALRSVAAGAGATVLAVSAFAAPSVADTSSSILPPLPLPWPTESPSPDPDEPGEPGEPPEPTGEPVPTLPPDPTDEPTTDPTGEPPEPTDEPTSPDPSGAQPPDPSPSPSESPDPSGTASPDPTPSPTESPVIEVPEGETPAEPRELETPDKPAGEEPAHLTGSQLTMSGLSYDGIVEVPTDSGSIRSLQFSMDKSVVDDFSLLVPSSDGHDLLTLSNQLTVSGDVKFYTNRFSGRLLGIPLTFTPDFPPPLVLPNMTFGDPDINLVYIDSDSLTADTMRQFFPD
ncbi:hypothetical protein CLV30_12051 [Haloactinopolyspora alba]|uniref:Uncharacterized protein n=1 Tax=Haloactinopolyspora alba TaxID=648780 RepID=A0A2P8DM42_9ACTN|nr:DUF6114 domain-containing protein [Haloactinopolyspora alba]PSK98265.1 hypothetical protein CLV30_12051 [Haloactinopolyspora alba]